MFHFFDNKMRKVFFLIFFSTKCEKCFTFFDKMRKTFQFFRQNAKSVLLFSIKCKKCFNFFDKMRKVFYFFRQNAKSVLLFFDKMRKRFQFFLQKAKSVYKMQYRLGDFLLVYSFSSVFPNMCAKFNQIFLICVRVRST